MESRQDSETKSIEEKEKLLLSLTTSFFEEIHINATWKGFPATKLAGTNYANHEARFFTMQNEIASQADSFVNDLYRNGVNATLKQAKNNKPSIVVDLTTSSFSRRGG